MAVSGFGKSIALSATHLAVGCDRSNVVRVYEIGADDHFGEAPATTIMLPDGPLGSISVSTMAITQTHLAVTGGYYTSVFIFEQDGDGHFLHTHHTLYNQRSTGFSLSGWTLGLTRNYLVIPTQSGAALVFRRAQRPSPPVASTSVPTSAPTVAPTTTAPTPAPTATPSDAPSDSTHQGTSEPSRPPTREPSPHSALQQCLEWQHFPGTGSRARSYTTALSRLATQSPSNISCAMACSEDYHLEGDRVCHCWTMSEYYRTCTDAGVCTTSQARCSLHASPTCDRAVGQQSWMTMAKCTRRGPSTSSTTRPTTPHLPTSAGPTARPTRADTLATTPPPLPMHCRILGEHSASAIAAPFVGRDGGNLVLNSSSTGRVLLNGADLLTGFDEVYRQLNAHSGDGVPSVFIGRDGNDLVLNSSSAGEIRLNGVALTEIFGSSEQLGRHADNGIATVHLGRDEGSWDEGNLVLNTSSGGRVLLNGANLADIVSIVSDLRPC